MNTIYWHMGANCAHEHGFRVRRSNYLFFGEITISNQYSLNCLPMLYKKGTRFIWLNPSKIYMQSHKK